MRRATLDFLRVIMFSGAISASSALFAWGAGHDYVNRGSIKIMPREIKEFLGEENLRKFVHWSHAPDSMVPFKTEIAKKQYPVTEEEIAFLKSFKAKNFYCLHSTRKPGQAGNFILLVKAFIDKDPARSAFWMSALMHTVADDGACNHTSQIHYLTYAFRKSDVKMGKGIGFDFADVAKTKEGKDAVAAILAEYKPNPLPNDPSEAITQILDNDAKASTFATKREFKIVRTYAPNCTPAQRREGVEALAELGCYGMTRTMDFIITAWKFAKEGTIPTLSAADFERAAKARRAYFAERPLSDDSIYTGLLKSPESASKPSVGVILDRSAIMMSHHLSFGGRLVMAAAMRTMKTAGVPYVTIDLRDLNKPESTLLDPARIPVVAFCSGSLAIPRNAKKALKRYAENGGRFLLIGGTDGGLLGELSKHLVKADPKMLPVTKRYGCNNKEVIDKIRIRFLPPINVALGNKEYAFVNNPDTTAGSQKPVCLLKIDNPTDGIKPLAELSVGEKRIIVAAALMNGGKTAAAVFLPEYLVAPFILDETVRTEMVDVANIQLDKVGAPLFLESLKLLGMNK